MKANGKIISLSYFDGYRSIVLHILHERRARLFDVDDRSSVSDYHPLLSELTSRPLSLSQTDSSQAFIHNGTG